MKIRISIRTERAHGGWVWEASYKDQRNGGSTVFARAAQVFDTRTQAQRDAVTTFRPKLTRAWTFAVHYDGKMATTMTFKSSLTAWAYVRDNLDNECLTVQEMRQMGYAVRRTGAPSREASG